MDIEQRVVDLEETAVDLEEKVTVVTNLLSKALTKLMPYEPEYDQDLYQKEPKGEIRNAMESERLKVRHQMAKSVAEIIDQVGISIDDLSKYGGIDKRTWKDLMLCAGSEYDYENLAAARQADDKYRSGISHLATSMKGLFVLREALRCLPMPVFSQEEFNKRKQSDEACEKLLEGHDGKCDGWASSFRTAKLFAQQQGYLGA